MKDAVILAGGFGERIWPYNEIRNKSMLPIANKPILLHTIDCLTKLGIEKIVVLAHHGCHEIRHATRLNANVIVKEIAPNLGNAETLLEFEAMASENFFVFFGDCLICEEDLKRLIESDSDTILLDECTDSPHNHIICRHDCGQVKDFIAHPRGLEVGHYLVALHMNKTLFPYLKHNPGRFYNTKAGVGSPNECFLEQTLNDYVLEVPLKVLCCIKPCFDIDKPWHILDANSYWNEQLCQSLNKNVIADSAYIDESARIMGYIQLGENSKIGKNVWINGNCIIADNTIIDNGAIIGDSCVIGNDCLIQNYCKIGSHSTIGDACIIEQTAELLGGVLMRKDYLYHHGEFYGLCGEGVDFGAGTVCGTLRFDDDETTHVVNGRKEQPRYFANATYLGDYVRSGVGVIFQPGVMVGNHSIVGSGVVLNQKVLSNKCIYLKQELIETDWSVNKYGW